MAINIKPPNVVSCNQSVTRLVTGITIHLKNLLSRPDNACELGVLRQQARTRRHSNELKANSRPAAMSFSKPNGSHTSPEDLRHRQPVRAK
jgi:hypothetical protein